MILVCKDCGREWNGSTWDRNDQSGKYYQCGYADCNSKKRPIEEDEDIITENVRISKKIQRLTDSNTKERKAFREHARVENALESYSAELLSLFKEYGSQIVKPIICSSRNLNTDEVAVVHYTDTHFNEIINDVSGNKYDFKIASQRTYKYAGEIIKLCRMRNITKLVLCLGGDLLNSDRRKDELLNQATNRAKATFVAVDLIKHFITHLSKHFEVTVISVLGNESRASKDLGFSQAVLSDNYDYTIVNIVKLLIGDMVTWGNIDNVEEVIEVNGHRISVSHGLTKSTANANKVTTKIGIKYKQSDPCDFVLEGHIHSANVTSYSARSGGLCGGNSFASNALDLHDKASQVVLLVGKEYIHSMIIDLQHTNEDEWYDISESLEVYGCREHYEYEIIKQDVLKVDS